MDALFEGVYKKLLAPSFGKNLGGELPLYIQPIPPEQQSELNDQIKRLSNRLKKKGHETVTINLYDLCTTILSSAGVLDAILEDEANIPSEDIIAILDSVLDIKSVLIPKIKNIIMDSNPAFAFISGVGSVYPFIRSHGILNNIDELTNSCNLILFFPGDYNNLQLNHFHKNTKENKYKGHN